MERRTYLILPFLLALCRPALAEPGDVLRLAIEVQGKTEAENSRVGKITMTLGDEERSVYLCSRDTAATPVAGFSPASFTATATSYRGYTFTGFTIGQADCGTEITAGELTDIGSGATLTAHYTATTGQGICLWHDYSDDQRDAYRLPALVRTRRGRIIAFADYRPGNTDVGGGPTSIERRYSDDDGRTWSAPLRVAQGNWSDAAANYLEYSFGDAAAVADNTPGNSGDDILMVCAGGNKFWPYSFFSDDKQTPQLGCALWRSADGGKTWGSYTDITPAIMQAFTDAGLRRPEAEDKGIVRAFFSSGKITQSTRKARGARYNRLYSALVVNGGDAVVYSDDFGATWTVLGGQMANNGDEAHLVELPDGDLLLVGKSWGSTRWVNVFNYSDFSNAAGQWGQTGLSNNAVTTTCHGDIEAFVAYDIEGREHTVIVETAPTTNAPQRRNIQYYYVGVPKTSGFSVHDFAADGEKQVSWSEGMNVTQNWGAYSSLLSKGRGCVDILFEECAAGEHQPPTGYCLVYQHHELTDITRGRFFMSKKLARKAYKSLQTNKQ